MHVVQWSTYAMQIDKPTVHAELSCAGGGNVKRKNAMEQIEMFGKHFHDYDDSMNQCLENLTGGIQTRKTEQLPCILHVPLHVVQ